MPLWIAACPTPRLRANLIRPRRPSANGSVASVPQAWLAGAIGSSAGRVSFPLGRRPDLDLMERFGGLSDSKTGDRRAVATALGKLLRRALEALLREEAASRR